jgi:hypothetical protein
MLFDVARNERPKSRSLRTRPRNRVSGTTSGIRRKCCRRLKALNRGLRRYERLLSELEDLKTLNELAMEEQEPRK